jgi:hypothetical protein
MSFFGSESLQVNVFCAVTILLLGVQTAVTRRKNEHSSNKNNRKVKCGYKRRHRNSACRCFNARCATSMLSAAR